MNSINIETVQKLLLPYQQQQTLQKHFLEFKKKYSNRITFYSPQQILEKINKINRPQLQPLLNQPEKEQNQMLSKKESKIFNWIVTLYCQIEGVTLELLTQNHFALLQEILHSKPIILLKYEVADLINENTQTNSSPWTEEERELLTFIVRSKKKPLDWRRISYELFRQSKGTLFRNFQDCKSQWQTHLNPTINRQKWTIEDDIKLLKKCSHLNCNWKQIKESFDQAKSYRMLKSRYKSILQKFNLEDSGSNMQETIADALQFLKKQQIMANQIQRQNNYANVQLESAKMEQRLCLEEKMMAENMAGFNNLDDRQYTKELSDIENDSCYSDRCLTDMFTRSEQITEKLMEINHQQSGPYQNRNPFQCSFPSFYFVQHPAELCDQVVYTFRNEWLENDQNQHLSSSNQVFLYQDQ